ncbi:hypothetical protein C8R44DRAFT_875557 [Mycena epipterygia]|nr:hypothetical protein C8R44DRAFT_875557 [Mycena epipterygia]
MRIALISLVRTLHRFPTGIPRRTSTFTIPRRFVTKFAPDHQLASTQLDNTESDDFIATSDSDVTQPAPDQQPALEELEKTATNDLVASFMQFMDLVKDDEKKQREIKQTAWIRDKFRAPELQIPSQVKIAENVIRFLFERRLFDQAVVVYQHILDDGLLPTPSTDALFLAVALVASKAPGKNQLEGFKTILGYSSFTESLFMELLDHVMSLNIPPVSAVLLTRLFISVKHESYRPSRSLIMKLVDLQAKAGEIEAAAETIEEYGFNEDNQSLFDAPELYAQVIHSTPHPPLPTSDQAAVDWIMGVMMEKDVPIHILVFNSLIERQKHSKDLRKAFAFYGLIIRLAATTPLRPDAMTYKHLFRLLGYQYKNNYKPNASRRKERVVPITAARQLFSDMMALWFSTKFHPPVSDAPSMRQTQINMDQSLMLLVFRAFLYVHDYPGALVVLRTTSELGLQITTRMYFVLMRYLARKVYYDVYESRMQHKKPLFAIQLIGPFNRCEIDEDPHVAYRWIMERLLEHSCEQPEAKEMVDLDASCSHRIPTIDEVLETDALQDQLDPSPLVRMLHRTMQMQPFAGSSETRVDAPWGEEWRKRTLSKVRYGMLPRDISFWTWPQKNNKEAQDEMLLMDMPSWTWPMKK